MVIGVDTVHYLMQYVGMVNGGVTPMADKILDGLDKICVAIGVVFGAAAALSMVALVAFLLAQVMEVYAL